MVQAGKQILEKATEALLALEYLAQAHAQLNDTRFRKSKPSCMVFDMNCEGHV